MVLADEQPPSRSDDPGRLREEEVQGLQVLQDQVPERQVQRGGLQGPQPREVLLQHPQLGLGGGGDGGGGFDAGAGLGQHALELIGFLNLLGAIL